MTSGQLYDPYSTDHTENLRNVIAEVSVFEEDSRIASQLTQIKAAIVAAVQSAVNEHVVLFASTVLDCPAEHVRAFVLTQLWTGIEVRRASRTSISLSYDAISSFAMRACGWMRSRRRKWRSFAST